MSTTKSVVQYNFAANYIRTGRRYQTSILNPSCLPVISRLEGKCHFLGIQSLQSLSKVPRVQHSNHSKRDFTAVCSSNLQGPPPLPSDPSPGSWKVWIVGMLMTVIIPFWRNNWGPLLKLKKEVETVVETAEHVADIVEKVAEEVEKVAEEVAGQLPEGGKLKSAAIFVENVAKETAKDANLAEEFIDKVEELEKEVESFVEPVIDQANESTKEATDQS